MNLLGSFSKDRLTLGKLNQSLRRFVKSLDLKLKIIQTHDINKYVTLIQRNRNKVNGIILNLGPLHSQSELLEDTLFITKVPFVFVELTRHSQSISKSMIKTENIIMNDDILEGYKSAVRTLYT